MTRAEFISQLDQHVHEATFNDGKSTSKDSTFSGPPTVEFAPYGRIPNNKPRKDARQGTIDQDPEFIEFLESLTNPVPKGATADQEQENSTKAKEKVTTTPLIQYLRDKKANKGKEVSATAKGSKHARQDSKDGKTSSIPEKKSPAKPVASSSPDKRSAQAIKVENAARDAVKVLNKQAPNNKSEPQRSVASSTPTANVPASPAPSAEKKRERGNASVAARILQRDLGLGANPVGRGRGGRRGGSVITTKTDNATTSPQASSAGSTQLSKVDASVAPDKPIIQAQKAKTEAAANTVPSKEEAIKSQSTSSTKTPAPPTGPAASRTTLKPSPHARPNNQNVRPPSIPPKGPTVSPTATQAFLKHANPSQGITEPLLEEAFSEFGAVQKVEIDKKKGFAYVDFQEPDGLQKAIKARPVKVAQGQVVVLERKTGPSLQARNARGGPAMIGARGNMPIGPRGRGGSIRRGGGSSRPPYVANNGNPSKTTQTPVTAAQANSNPASAAAPNETKADVEAAPSVAPTTSLSDAVT